MNNLKSFVVLAAARETGGTGVARFSARPARAPRSLSDSRTPLKGGVSFSRTSSQQVASTESR